MNYFLTLVTGAVERRRAQSDKCVVVVTSPLTGNLDVVHATPDAIPPFGVVVNFRPLALTQGLTAAFLWVLKAVVG